MPLRTARRLYRLLSTTRSELRLRERERLLEERISHMYRFVDFGRLASGIFHDLLNPLSVVALSVEKLKEAADISIDPKTQEHVERALRASRRVESFMRTAKKQLDYRDRDLVFAAGPEVEDAISLLSYKSKKAGVDIDFKTTQEIYIKGNPANYFRIAKNLLSNAIDSYSTAPTNRPRRVEITLSLRDETCILSVKDKGCGIPDDMRSLVFEPFFTTKLNESRETSGLGLGLMYTKDFAERHFKGYIELESTLGAGSTFTVFVPLAPKASEKTTRANIPTESLLTEPSRASR